MAAVAAAEAAEVAAADGNSPLHELTLNERPNLEYVPDQEAKPHRTSLGLQHHQHSRNHRRILVWVRRKATRNKSFYATAEINEDGTTFIREIIDTDFAGTDQRGIFRDIPDVESIDYVHSPYAPDSRRVLSRREIAEFGGNCFIGQRWTCLRIGEPDINNYGLHRYIIDYQLKPRNPLGRKSMWIIR